MKYASMLNNLVFAYIKMRQKEENWHIHTQKSTFTFSFPFHLFFLSQNLIYPKLALNSSSHYLPQVLEFHARQPESALLKHCGKEPTVEHRQESWRHSVVSISHACSGLPNGWLRVWEGTCLAGAKRATPQQRKECPRERQSKYSQKPGLMGTA